MEKQEMTDEERNKLAVDAALAFIAETPAFIALPENSKVIVQYLEAHPELNPVEISSYRQAFSACRDRLRFEHQMSAEEFKTAVVIPAWQKKQHEKPKPSDTDVMLKDLFESRGYADSVTNRAAINQYMREHGLDVSLENLAHAIESVIEYPGLEPSEAAIAAMPSFEYRKIVEREFKEQQAKRAPTNSDKPWGVNWSNWINNR
jgi:hypothetical protein